MERGAGEKRAHAKVAAEPDGEDHWRVTIEGVCTFLSLPRLHKALGSVTPGSTVELRMPVSHIDHAAQEFIDAWQRRHEACGGTVWGGLGRGGFDNLCTESAPTPARQYDGRSPE